ncbi:MAG: carbon-nitrogen family hydrolase [Phycisphaerales bacterium]
MKVHLFQTNPVWEDRPGNLDRARRLVEATNPAQGDLVIFPEMFDTGFSMDARKNADRDGRTSSFLMETAARFGCCVLGGRTVPGGDGKGKNVATAFGPDANLLCEYAKVHPFTLGGEHEGFEPGDRVEVFEWGGMKIAPIICYDLRFPELFRKALLMGAEAFAVIACWPKTRAAHWRALLIARAIENQAWVFGCNRSGNDPKLEFMGGSMAVAPTGEVVAESFEIDACVSADVDADDVRRWRRKFPAWKDHRLL